MRWVREHIRVAILAALMILVMVLVISQWSSSSYDDTILKYSNIETHINELSKEVYGGRLAGSEGNEKAVTYVADFFDGLNLVPIGDDHTYLQSFNVMMPNISNEASFVIQGQGNSNDLELELYKDYKWMTSMNGGGTTYAGELFLVGSNLKRVEPEEIKDRIVVIEASRLEQARVDYVIEHGGKGLICSSDVELYYNPRRYEAEKTLDVFGQTGEQIAVGYMSKEAYTALEERINVEKTETIDKAIGLVEGVTIDSKITYPIVHTANIVGMIEGKNTDQTMILSASLDGSGLGPNGAFFPSASNNLTGLGTMLELARVMSLQNNKPAMSVVFVAYNGQKQLNAGSSYFVNHTPIDLSRAKVIHMENLGRDTQDGLTVIGDRRVSGLFSNTFSAYATDASVRVTEQPVAFGLTLDYSDMKVPALYLAHDFTIKDDYYDTPDLVDTQAMNGVTSAIQNFVKRVVYEDVTIDYLPDVVMFVIVFMVLLYMLLFLLGIIYSRNPGMKLGHYTIEKLYHSFGIKLLRKTYQILVPVTIAVLLLVVLSNLDPNLNVKISPKGMETNFSPYLTLKNSMLYFERIGEWDLETLKKLGEVIYESGYKSLILLLSALGLSTFLGVIRGIYESYLHKKKGLKSVGMLVVFSIPDVLIVLGGVMLYIFIAKNCPEINEQYAPKDFILPLLTLSVIPTIYISRITFVALREEMNKVYVRNAKAMGISEWRIFTSELLPSVLFKLIDTLPTLMTMLLTNMIIVEHLFNYIGIVYFLLFFYSKQEADSFVALALTLGFIYILLTWGIQKVANKLNPLRKEA